MAKQETPGFQYAALLPNGESLDCAAGVRDAFHGGAIHSTTVFLSASTSKILTAILALQVVEQGILDLDEPLQRHLPELGYADQVTLRMLLTHTSGAPNPSPLRWVHLREEHQDFDEPKALDAILESYPKPAFKPGTRTVYSNVGYWLTGRLLERLTGFPFAALIEERIVRKQRLAPEGMSCAMPQKENYTRGHLHRWSPVCAIARLLTPRRTWLQPNGRWARCADLYMNGPSYGGVFASAQAYLAVLRDLLSESPVLLKSGMRDELLKEQKSPDGMSMPYSLGFRAGFLGTERYLSKPGGGPGFSSNVRLYPRARIATVWMRNVLAASEKPIEIISDALDFELLSGRPI